MRPASACQGCSIDANSTVGDAGSDGRFGFAIRKLAQCHPRRVVQADHEPFPSGSRFLGLAGPLQRSRHGADLEAGQQKKLSGSLPPKPPARHLIQHQPALRSPIDEHAVYVGAVKALDETAIEIQAADLAPTEAGQGLRTVGALGFVAQVTGLQCGRGELPGLIVALAEIQLEALRGRHRLGHRIDHIRADIPIGHRPRQRIGVQNIAAVDLLALRRPRRSRKAQHLVEAPEALQVAPRRPPAVMALVKQQQRLRWI